MIVILISPTTIFGKYYDKYQGVDPNKADDESIREIIYGAYRIMYRLMQNGDIRITSVVHGARDWKP